MEIVIGLLVAAGIAVVWLIYRSVSKTDMFDK